MTYNKKRTLSYGVILISVLLAYFCRQVRTENVLTNDLHQLVFRFSKQPPFSDKDYSYGIVFMVILIAGDMTAVCCLLMAAIFQGCILCGLIQTNNRYFELFQTSGGLDAEITDHSFQRYYHSGDFPELSSELRRIIIDRSSVQEQGIRINHIPIRGGHLFWSEDISVLLDQYQDIREQQEELTARNRLLQKAYQKERRKMISFVECSMAIQNVLMILLEICMILELILLLVRITCFSGKKKIVTAVAVFIVSFMFMGALMNDHRYCLGESSYQPMLQGYPVSVLMTVVIGLLLYLCWSIRSERRRYYHSLSYWSVNEAVNDVPCGVCFSDPLGRIVLCNTKMQELSRIMTGSYLQDYEVLRKAMSGELESEGLCRLSKDSNVFYFPDGSVWMFQEYSRQEPDCAGYLQTVAVNVSEIYYNGEKIRANNEKLEILNHKLEEMYEKIGDKIREQETLVMKMQVHDNFGRSLLSIRRILERKEDPDKMDKQLSVLKHLVYILTGSAVESMEEVYEDTIRHAEELGISVQISGNFPMHPSYRLLTDRAIRECVTNCARHAHGSTVWVKIDKNADEYTVQITNDGEVPDKNAEEGGGLSALRKAAESGKCRMQVSFSPEFCLILKMPLAERMGFDGTDTDSRRSEDHAEVF